jgi:hypothetical protein
MDDPTGDNPPPATDGPAPAISDRERTEVGRLLALLNEESKTRWPILHVGCVTCLAIPLGLLSACYLLLTITSPYALIIAAAAAAGVYFATRLSMSGRQRQSLLRLAELHDTRSVPALLTALAWPDLGDLESVLESALVRLLPRLRASDVEMLTWRHRAILRRHLRSRNTDLVISILRALEQVGNRDDLPLVSALARGRTRTARQREIVVAAKACLPALEARFLEPGHSLLRVPSDADDSLLRPTGGPGDVDPNQLLRPDDPTSEEGND